MKNVLQSFIQQKAKGPVFTSVQQDSEVRANYTEFEKRSDAFAMLLKDAGCKEGDYICCMTGKMSSTLISMLGIMKAGCICVPVRPGSAQEHICSTMFEIDSRWLFTDECVSPLPDSLLFETGEISLGWLGDLQKVPEGIAPEFVFENIDQYLTEPDLVDNRVKKSAFKYILPDSKGHQEEFRIAPASITAFIDQYGDVLSGRFSDRVAGFFPDQLLRFFMELSGPAKQETSFYLMSDSLIEEPERLMSLLYTRQITRLLVQEDAVKRLISSPAKRDVICEAVEEVVIWEKLPPRHYIDSLKKIFPKCDIKNRFRGGIHRKQFPMLGDSAAKVWSSVSQSRTDTASGPGEKVVFGLVEESTLNRFRSVDFIRDVKAVYLNYWRRVEEKNLWVVDTPIKGTFTE